MTSSSLDTHAKKILRVNPAQSGISLARASCSMSSYMKTSNAQPSFLHLDARDKWGCSCTKHLLLVGCRWIPVMAWGSSATFLRISSSPKRLCWEPEHLILFSELPESGLRACETLWSPLMSKRRDKGNPNEWLLTWLHRFMLTESWGNWKWSEIT